MLVTVKTTIPTTGKMGLVLENVGDKVMLAEVKPDSPLLNDIPKNVVAEKYYLVAFNGTQVSCIIDVLDVLAEMKSLLAVELTFCTKAHTEFQLAVQETKQEQHARMEQMKMTKESLLAEQQQNILQRQTLMSEEMHYLKALKSLQSCNHYTQQNLNNLSRNDLVKASKSHQKYLRHNHKLTFHFKDELIDLIRFIDTVDGRVFSKADYRVNMA